MHVGCSPLPTNKDVWTGLREVADVSQHTTAFLDSMILPLVAVPNVTFTGFCFVIEHELGMFFIARELVFSQHGIAFVFCSMRLRAMLAILRK